MFHGDLTTGGFARMYQQTKIIIHTCSKLYVYTCLEIYISREVDISLEHVYVLQFHPFIYSVHDYGMTLPSSLKV